METKTKTRENNYQNAAARKIRRVVTAHQQMLADFEARVVALKEEFTVNRQMKA